MRAAVDSLRIRAVVPEAFAVLRTSWHELLLLGLLLFVPLGLLTALAPGDGIEVDRLDDPHLLTAVPLGVAQVVAPLLGTVLFAGAASSAVSRHRGQEVGGVIDLARSLPYWKLIAADILLVVATGLGLIVFIVPGVIALVWFSLVAPVIEHEDLTVRGAFRKSRELVRGHFRQVAWLVWPAVLLQAVIEGLAEEVVFDALGHGFFAEWLASILANILADPVFALVVVILYLELTRLKEASARAR
ncbi:MAG: hypothetical protein R2700_00035 [Solirubrobacterales bacterium]|nr:hypothetical protein [Solirubrobacterales bacterium]